MTPSSLRTLPPGAIDDIDVLRQMYPHGAVEISGIDPRLNASEISRRLGVSRARVATRVRAWETYGFLGRYDVWPNPSLFGLTGVTFDLRVSDRLAKGEVVDRIGLVPGAIGGMDLLGEWMAVTFTLPIGEDPARTAALLRSLAGVAEVGVPIPWAPQETHRTLSPLEQRIVRVLRRYPRDSLASVARHVGVSTRTITTRYARLLDEHSVWFIPVFDFRALAEPVVSLTVRFRSGSDRHAFARSLRHTYPRSLEFLRQPFGPMLSDTDGAYFVLVGSAARVEELERWARRSTGVEGIEALTLVRILSFPETFDRLIDRRPPGAAAGR